MVFMHGRRMIHSTTDHSGLNQLHGVEDENFCLVRPELQRMVQTAPSITEAKCRYMNLFLMSLIMFIEALLISYKILASIFGDG